MTVGRGYQSSTHEGPIRKPGLSTPLAQQLRASIISKQAANSSGLKSHSTTTSIREATSLDQIDVAEHPRPPVTQTNENLILFMKAARPDWSQVDLDSALERLAKVNINNVLMLVTALRGKGSWKKIGLNAKMEAAGVSGFTDATLQSLKTQAEVLEQTVKSGQPLAPKDVNAVKADTGLNHDASSSAPDPSSSNPPLAFQVQSQRRAASQRTSRNQMFRVVSAIVDVHAMPNSKSKIIAKKYAGDIVSGADETFDRWVRLETEVGWINRGADEQILAVESDVPLLVAAEASNIAGPQAFKVIFEPHVPVCSVPVQSREVVTGLRNFGDVLFAEAQSYNGWIQLVDGGWVPGFDPDEHVMMLSCIGLNKEKELQASISESRAAMADAKEKLQGHDLDHARAYAKYQGWSVRLAELQHEQESWLDLRQRVLKEKDDVRALFILKGDAEKLGFHNEVILINLFLARLAEKKSGIASGHSELLKAITDAALAGDLLSVAMARDVAREAGVPKKEIARAFALGNSRQT